MRLELEKMLKSLFRAVRNEKGGGCLIADHLS